VAAIGRAALLIGALAAGLALASPASAALRFRDCGGERIRCARLSVPLDRAGTVPGRVSLLVIRRRANRRTGKAPLVFLAGGPGQPAIEALFGFGIFHPAYLTRDIVVFDQRGTGRSGLLRCPRLERSNLLQAGAPAAACARRLGVRRAFYTSRDSVDDIEAIRRGIGARRIALFGVSYGTKVALGYASTYPDRVERLVLDSAVEADGPDPLYRDSAEGTPRVLRALCAGRCEWTGDPVGDLAALVDRIAASGPVRGPVVDARGRVRAGRLTSEDLLTILLAGDFEPTLRRGLPGAVSAALGGDAAPVLRLFRRALPLEAMPPPPLVFSSALYAATTCEEALLPWDRSTPPDPAERHRQAAARAAAIPDSAFEPFDRAGALDSDTLELCERWPHAPVARGFGPGPLPDVPVLVLQGEEDLRTPVEDAQRVTPLFPRSSLVVAPTGHSVHGNDVTGCAGRAFANFFRDRPVESRCARRVRRPPPTPPPPGRLADVAPHRGVPGERGRTLAAARLTLDDVAVDSSTAYTFDPDDPSTARGGGLRSGSYRIGRDGTLVLEGLSFVPGVTLSGRLRQFGISSQRGRLRIGGSAAAHGLLRVERRRFRGRLSGRSVRGAFDPPARVAASARKSPWRLPRL